MIQDKAQSVPRPQSGAQRAIEDAVATVCDYARSPHLTALATPVVVLGSP